MTSLPEQCCTLPPFKSDYEPIGERVKVDVDGQEYELYITGPKESQYGLIGIFDIFGMHNNTLQGADHLAKKCGYKIIVPDFFRGKAWPVDNIPPREGRPALNAWIQEVGSWEKVRPTLLAAVERLKQEGATSIGAYGFCFGSKKLAQAAHEELFKAVALIHPSFFQPEDADNMTVPVALLPSQGEDKDVMNGFWERIQKKPFADKCIRQDFLDVHHGFASARSDWSDPRLAGRAKDAYEIMATFFKNNL